MSETRPIDEPEATASAFSRIKLRVAAIVRCEGDVALIRRVKDGVEQYTVAGGNVEAGEPIEAALRRELAEELDLELSAGSAPELVAVQDQMVTRPGPTAPSRKLHLVFLVDVTSDRRDALASIEHDDLSDGEVVWMPLVEASKAHLYPDIGRLLAALDDGVRPRSGGAVLLPPMTDASFAWL